MTDYLKPLLTRAEVQLLYDLNKEHADRVLESVLACDRHLPHRNAREVRWSRVALDAYFERHSER